MLNVAVSNNNGTIEIVPDGDIDLHTAPALRRAVLDALNHDVRQICVVLTSVSFMDSSGVAILVEGFRAARKDGKTFVLRAPSAPVMELLQLARLDTVFTILDKDA